MHRLANFGLNPGYVPSLCMKQPRPTRQSLYKMNVWYEIYELRAYEGRNRKKYCHNDKTMSTPENAGIKNTSAVYKREIQTSLI